MATIRSISGEQIDYALTLAMNETLNALAKEGIITQEQAIEFADTHICIEMNDSNVFNRIAKYIGFSPSEGSSIPVILKVP